MIRLKFDISLKEGQELLFFGLGDIHFDTAECDRKRVEDLVTWVQRQAKDQQVRIVGVGDYLDFGSPSERKHLATDLHETTNAGIDQMWVSHAREFIDMVKPLGPHFLGLLSGHHYHRFYTRRVLGPEWQGRISDEWLADQLKTRWLGTGTTLFRLQFPHNQYLDVLALHGAGGAQTPGGRVQKRIRFAEIAPTAHLVLSGHDNAKLAYPRSGMDWERGLIKRYVLGTGSFQRAYLEDQLEAGYAERWGLAPADLGISLATIRIEKRRGKFRVDYHCSV